MNYCEKIPVKTEAVRLDGESVKIDTEGLEAVITSVEGDAYIKVNSAVKDEDAYMLANGRTITLNGCFYLSGNGAGVRILYNRVI